MKKILALVVVVLSFSSSAFAAGQLGLAAVSDVGTGVYGGADQTTAQNSTNPLVRCSTGVHAFVNTPAPVANIVSTYLIGTKHYKGSKSFATASDSTNIYWKASPARTTAPYVVAGDFPTGTDNSSFPAGSGWTAY